MLPGTAREALHFYARVFGGDVELHTYGEFGRDDGPEDAVAHGVLTGPVSLYAADAAVGESALATHGLMFTLLGAAPPTTLHLWFDQLADGGRVVEALEERPWGAVDGQVVDRFGLHWLVGYEHA